jgi:hypothetical protein
MSLYMNDYDLQFAERRFANTPNRLAVVDTINRLKDWTGANSDGWAYWAPPRKAAAPLMRLVNSTTNALNDLQEANDATPAVVRRAAATLRGFCTRAQRAGLMTAEQASWILAPVDIIKGA